MAKNKEMPLPPTAPEQSGEEMEGHEGSEMPPPPEAPEAPPVAPKKVYSGPKDIQVVAIAKGFYDQHRKNEGDEFVVPTMKQLGSWMKCKDPKIQRMHEEAIRIKRKKANSAED